jgi:hypothetical protein
MIRGRIIAESLQPGADIQIDGLRLIRLGRHDVSTSTLPADEPSDDAEQHGVVAGQPTTWTFIDIEVNHPGFRGGSDVPRLLWSHFG